MLIDLVDCHLVGSVSGGEKCNCYTKQSLGECGESFNVNDKDDCLRKCCFEQCASSFQPENQEKQDCPKNVPLKYICSGCGNSVSLSAFLGVKFK